VPGMLWPRMRSTRGKLGGKRGVGPYPYRSVSRGSEAAKSKLTRRVGKHDAWAGQGGTKPRNEERGRCRKKGTPEEVVWGKGEKTELEFIEIASVSFAE